MLEFLGSNEVAQVECFWEAMLIGIRKEGAYTMICKQHEYFYIEYKVKNEMFAGMRVFKNPDLLHLYLEQIEIKLPA